MWLFPDFLHLHFEPATVSKSFFTSWAAMSDLSVLQTLTSFIHQHGKLAQALSSGRALPAKVVKGSLSLAGEQEHKAVTWFFSTGSGSFGSWGIRLQGLLHQYGWQWILEGRREQRWEEASACFSQHLQPFLFSLSAPKADHWGQIKDSECLPHSLALPRGALLWSDRWRKQAAALFCHKHNPFYWATYRLE